MKVLNQFQKSKQPIKSEIELPLAPMASVFTVILVFLIKSVSMNFTSLSPAAEVDLPEISIAGDIPDALKVEISGSTIQVADKPVMSMKNFLPNEGNSAFKKLEEALLFERGENKADRDPRLVIVSDKGAPYQLLKQVMASAGNSGFSDLKLVVVEGD